MYELLKLIAFAEQKASEGKKLVLATIVHTIGSSYRKTGTQMIIAQDLAYEGALSGGCVEKEVLRQSLHVFSDGKNVVFEYDGRYKLGCNGRIYVLIEPLEKNTLEKLSPNIYLHHLKRIPFRLQIRRNDELSKGCTAFWFGNEKVEISTDDNAMDTVFVDMHPQYQVVIIGGEYDSVTLANVADQTGMQVTLIVKESFTHHLSKNVKVTYGKPETLTQLLQFDSQTAIVIMTHSLSKDLSFLIEMIKVPSAYLGVLGPRSRRDQLLNDLMNYDEALFLAHQDKLEGLYGPIGMDIGARTPEEISISILSQIISVFNQSKVPVTI